MAATRGRPKGSQSKRNELASKTETLTIRLDEKTRFLLDFLARLRGQTITKVVERAVRAFAETSDNIISVDQEDLYSRFFYENADNIEWENYWDPHPGVRAVILVTLGGVELTAYEEELRRFVKAHKEFFYETDADYDNDGTPVHVQTGFVSDRIYVLWEHIDDYLELWKRTRANDALAVTRAMETALSAAGVSLPRSRSGQERPPTPAQRPNSQKKPRG